MVTDKSAEWRTWKQSNISAAITRAIEVVRALGVEQGAIVGVHRITERVERQNWTSGVSVHDRQRSRRRTSGLGSPGSPGGENGDAQYEAEQPAPSPSRHGG